MSDLKELRSVLNCSKVWGFAKLVGFNTNSEGAVAIVVNEVG